MRARPLSAAAVALGAVALAVLLAPGPTGTGVPPSAQPGDAVVYDAELKGGWQDWGWSPRELGKGPARLDLTDYGGWILAHPGFDRRFGSLVFRLRAPAGWAEWLEVRLDAEGARPFPAVRCLPEHRRRLEDGWEEIRLPMGLLAPDARRFDRIVFHASGLAPPVPVELDRIALAEQGERRPRAPARPPREARMRVDCAGPRHRISPLIYGIAYDPRLDGRDRHPLRLGAAARRWGGNPSSRYNWRLGNAWNTASDWFFRNVDYTGVRGFTYERFLEANRAHGMATALTVPTLGWVAKDRSSFSFPVSLLGPQRRTDPDHPDAGDGHSPSGEPLAAGDPGRTSIRAPPESIGAWVAAIREGDRARGTRSVRSYILDNEPMLWSSTHRDVHPEPVGYDELLERTLAYGTAVRRADPEARIAGPALWGWPALFYSAKDAQAGFALAPDRAAHGGEPLLPWLLRRLEAHRRKTGTRILDLVDVHFYPQAAGIGVGEEGDTSPEACARRLRATRALWDPGYADESWIGEPVRLLPRLQEWIAQTAPGLGVSIGEYNFGAEGHPCGGLALAEALGRFGEAGIDSAYYWTYPADRSPAFWAFRAFRDFDGEGGRFLDFSLPTRAPAGLSLFASSDEERGRVVLVALNLDSEQPARAEIALEGCAPVAGGRTFALTDAAAGLAVGEPPPPAGAALTRVLPPYSITIFDLELERPGKE